MATPNAPTAPPKDTNFRAAGDLAIRADRIASKLGRAGIAIPRSVVLRRAIEAGLSIIEADIGPIDPPVDLRPGERYVEIEPEAVIADNDL